MGWQGYDNEGCMPGDRERVARMRDRRMETDCKRRIAAAKRDLAEKVLGLLRREASSYDGMRLTDHGRGGKQKLRQVTEAIESLFTESGVTVETKGGNSET
jgi:hypothetical protein